MPALTLTIARTVHHLILSTTLSTATAVGAALDLVALVQLKQWVVDCLINKYWKAQQVNPLIGKTKKNKCNIHYNKNDLLLSSQDYCASNDGWWLTRDHSTFTNQSIANMGSKQQNESNTSEIKSTSTIANATITVTTNLSISKLPQNLFKVTGSGNITIYK